MSLIQKKGGKKLNSEFFKEIMLGNDNKNYIGLVQFVRAISETQDSPLTFNDGYSTMVVHLKFNSQTQNAPLKLKENDIVKVNLLKYKNQLVLESFEVIYENVRGIVGRPINFFDYKELEFHNSQGTSQIDSQILGDKNDIEHSQKTSKEYISGPTSQELDQILFSLHKNLNPENFDFLKRDPKDRMDYTDDLLKPKKRAPPIYLCKSPQKSIENVEDFDINFEELMYSQTREMDSKFIKTREDVRILEEEKPHSNCLPQREESFPEENRLILLNAYGSRPDPVTVKLYSMKVYEHEITSLTGYFIDSTDIVKFNARGNELVEKLINILKVGYVYEISSYSVIKKSYNCLSIEFSDSTNITKTRIIPFLFEEFYMFKKSDSFIKSPNNLTFDIAGIIINEVIEKVNSTSNTKMVFLEIADLGRYKFSLNIWNIDCLLGHKLLKGDIVIFRRVKLNIYPGKCVLSSITNLTRIEINHAIYPEIQALKELQKSSRSLEFLQSRKYPKILDNLSTIEQVRSKCRRMFKDTPNASEQRFLVFGTLTDFINLGDPYYKACKKCEKKVIDDNHEFDTERIYFCKFCDSSSTNFVYRSKLRVRIKEHTGSLEAMIFAEDLVEKVMKISMSSLAKKTREEREIQGDNSKFTNYIFYLNCKQIIYDDVITLSYSINDIVEVDKEKTFSLGCNRSTLFELLKKIGK